MVFRALLAPQAEAGQAQNFAPSCLLSAVFRFLLCAENR
jgi:hypothetical protein